MTAPDDDQSAKTPIASEPQESLMRLAERALDEGNDTKVSELFSSALERGLPGAEAARWHLLLLEAGDTGAAERAAGMAGKSIERPVSHGNPPAPEEASGDDEFLDFEPGGREEPAGAVVPRAASTFLRFFAGRGDVYARQWHDARKGATGYWPVREALSPRVVADHLLGRITIGQYVLHPDETVSFAVLDLDPAAALMEWGAAGGREDGGLGLPPLVDYTRRLLETGRGIGLAPLAEATGGDGIHVWFLFVPRIAASRARALMNEILFRTGAQPPGVSVEVFPKQDHLRGKGFGNLVKLPLGVHQATCRRSRFLSSAMQPVEDDDGLAIVVPSEPSAVEAALAGRVVEIGSRSGARPVEARESTPSRRPEDRRLVEPAGATPRNLAEALAAIPAGREAAAAVDRILAGCTVLRELARQALEERKISPDAARALVYTVGLVGRENERVESLLHAAEVSRKELDRVRQGLQAPMGCKKLRESFPLLAGKCRCPQPPEGGYATPALLGLASAPTFARSSSPAGGARILADAAESIERHDLEARLSRIEAALEKLLERRV
jgi:hypothetical protein